VAHISQCEVNHYADPALLALRIDLSETLSSGRFPVTGQCPMTGLMIQSLTEEVLE